MVPLYDYSQFTVTLNILLGVVLVRSVVTSQTKEYQAVECAYDFLKKNIVKLQLKHYLKECI